MSRPGHILLVGFMGSGKTSVSRRLAAITGLPLVDVDQRIVDVEQRDIAQIFSDEGETGFRTIETRVLASLADEDRCVISCGGGIVCGEENRRILRELGCVIYLNVGVDEALGRISRPETRPMLSGPRPVAEIFEERLPLYEEVADITIDTSGRSVYEVADLCKAALEERGLL